MRRIIVGTLGFMMAGAIAACGSSDAENGGSSGTSQASSNTTGSSTANASTASASTSAGVTGSGPTGSGVTGSGGGSSTGAPTIGGTGAGASGGSTSAATIGSTGVGASGGVGGSGGGGETVCGVTPELATGHVVMENLCRGVVAVRTDDGNFISWRLMGYEDPALGFNVYRDGTKVNDAPITDSTNFVDAGAPADATYTVRAVLGDVEQGDSANTRGGDPATPTWAQNYLAIPLQTSEGYTAGDASPGDLNGDGDYELVVKEEQTPRDPSQDGVTGQPKFAAYDTDGTLLWRIDLGINIRESEHTTPFVVYDLDGDGRAELAVKTAPGASDGSGAFLSTGPAEDDDDSEDYRNSAGKIVSGPEYLTVFSGIDGAELETIEYHAPITSGSFGDNTGNRSDRYNATVAFLDETGSPSAVMQRGYYERTTFGAYNYRDGELSLLWKFDSNDEGHGDYAGMGTHSLMVADTDGDLRQEIIPGAATIGADGEGKCAVDFYGHGDALHITDLVPSRPGLEVFQPTEATGVPSYFVRDADTCEILWQGPNTPDEGPGRGCADDIDPTNPGGEVWTNNAGLFAATDGEIVGQQPGPENFLAWWDGDESRELLDGNRVTDFDGEGGGFTAEGCTSINGTKSVPNLSADLFGDWREEIVFLCGDSLRIYTTNHLTTRRIYTLMHDPQYRANVSSQNASYNQPPHTSFHIGNGMVEPPRPNISVK